MVFLIENLNRELEILHIVFFTVTNIWIVFLVWYLWRKI